ncbi:hypothetical protein SPSYN_01076 [Sporotomaculum syntrophicum]|uniref:Uncharacterized protein n=1 Tax=Sporotomaculum syntrophicum TaxID=182264 RepID=A0A9D3AW42_9FIRM|nr:hypothetical protein SPSYN_01076 [Sporotomaculum syntrophicum]
MLEMVDIEYIRKSTLLKAVQYVKSAVTLT